MDAAALMVSVSFIDQKLDRVRKYIIQTYSPDGFRGMALDPDHQYAIRVIDSRRRELQRILLVRTRPVHDIDRMKAEVEMTVHRRDTGEMFRWAGYSHGFGRLGCGGCAFDYVSAYDSLPVRTIKARLCTVCGNGIQHSAAADTGDEARQAVEEFHRSVVRHRIGHRIDVGPLRKDVGVIDGPRLVYCCDVNGCWGIEG